MSKRRKYAWVTDNANINEFYIDDAPNKNPNMEEYKFSPDSQKIFEHLVPEEEHRKAMWANPVSRAKVIRKVTSLKLASDIKKQKQNAKIPLHMLKDENGNTYKDENGNPLFPVPLFTVVNGKRIMTDEGIRKRHTLHNELIRESVKQQLSEADIFTRRQLRKKLANSENEKYKAEHEVVDKNWKKMIEELKFRNKSNKNNKMGGRRKSCRKTHRKSCGKTRRKN